MANELKMAKINAIHTLRQKGWSCRRIARELGIHRETVGRYLQQAREGAKPAKVLTGSEDSKPAKVLTGSGDPKPAKVLTGPPASRSKCEAHRSVILAKLKQGLSAQRIYQDLVDCGFQGGYHSVRRFVRRLRASHPLPFRRMECEPGEQAQVDFGKGAPVVSLDGRRRRPHVLRIVLSHSRKAYSEAIFSQTTENFIRCLENAFWYFGGVPKVLVPDNLKAAVTKADWYDPDLNPKIRCFCDHYDCTMLPTRSYTPRHKGKVEKGVGYVQSNALKGLEFGSLEDENRHLLDWETRIADKRIHGTTRKQVGKIFEEVERPALSCLPIERFPFFHEGKRRVHRDAHAEVDKTYYSVPPEYLGHEVWVRWDTRMVRIFDGHMNQIAVHAKRQAGQFSTQPAHIHDRKISGVERGAEWLLTEISRVGPHTVRWAEAMLEARGIEGVRVLVGLKSMIGRHPRDGIEQACETAFTYGAFRLRTIRQLIKRQAPKQEIFEFIEHHPIIRDLTFYDDIVQVSFAKESTA